MQTRRKFHEMKRKRCDDVVTPIDGTLKECLEVLDGPVERHLLVGS